MSDKKKTLEAIIEQFAMDVRELAEDDVVIFKVVIDYEEAVATKEYNRRWASNKEVCNLKGVKVNRDKK